MKLIDRVYGEVKIDEPVLIKLINSEPIIRLKDISQLGMPADYYHIKGFSRYEHSLGVLALLSGLGANLEEQVAGLTHDASHTTFSHVIDWAFGDPTKEDYQDKIHKKVLENTEIKSIIEKANLNINRILNYSNFSLLEREAPSLCADRIDYSLREMSFYKERGFIQEIIQNLGVKENQIVFFDREIAEKFGREYMHLQINHWGGNEARVRYYLLSEVLKEAIKTGIIQFKDFEKTETPLLEKLNNSKNESIHEKMGLLKNGFKLIYENSDLSIELKKKFRWIDPEVSVNEGYSSLSTLSKEYKSLINFEKERNDKLVKVRFLPN